MIKTNINDLAKFKRSQRAVEIECQGTDFTPSFKKNVQVIKYCKKYVADYTDLEGGLPILRNPMLSLQNYFS